jgi:hypothetical protein
MKPTKSILDPSFRYRNAAQTDIRLTFAAARRRLKKAAPAMPSNVQPITTKRKSQ